MSKQIEDEFIITVEHEYRKIEDEIDREEFFNTEQETVPTEHEKSKVEYLYINDGLTKATTNNSIQPTLFTIERVKSIDKGFYLKAEGTYLFRYNRGIIIQGSKSEGHIFMYDDENNLLFIYENKQLTYLCGFEDKSLVGYSILKMDWNLSVPIFEVGGYKFQFACMQSGDSHSLTLYLDPGIINGRTYIKFKRESVDEKKGMNYLTFTIQQNDKMDKYYLCRNSRNRLVLTTNIKSAVIVYVDQGFLFVKINERLVPVCVGETNTMGYLLSIPDDFFKFYVA